MEKTACKGQCRSVLEEFGALCVTVGGEQWMLLWSVVNWITLPLVSFRLHFCIFIKISIFFSLQVLLPTIMLTLEPLVVLYTFKMFSVLEMKVD